MKHEQPFYLELKDDQWPFVGTDHDRQIVRAIVTDADGWFYFVRAERNDDFGKATLIESSGGGVEPGEALEAAIRRELREELGAEVDLLCLLGTVSDYYNLIRRHNLNHYYLCRVRSFGQKHLMPDEIEDFHLSTLKLRYEEAVREYERRACTPLGRLIAARELPVLRRAKALLDAQAAEQAAGTPGKTWGFYGWERADLRDARGLTPRDYYELLSGLWCAETCAPRMRKDWSPENPTLGQCSVTAFLMQDLFGGEVRGVPLGDGNFHCFNVVDGRLFDLTSEQFGPLRLNYENCPLQTREQHFAKEEKRQRYELLKSRLAALLAPGSGQSARRGPNGSAYTELP